MRLIKSWKLNRKDFYFVVLIIGLSLIKLWKLDGGFILGEPDERNYAAIVKNLYQSPYPYFDGWFFYHGLPLFHYVAYLFSFLFPIKFMSLRLVSWVFSLVLTLGIYFYLRWKSSVVSELLGALIFILTPLSVYYSRIGLMEMMVGALIFLAIATFEAAFTRESKWLAVLSGVCIGLGILTKYTAVPLLGLPFLYSVYQFKKYQFNLKKYLIPVITLASAVISGLPLFAFIYFYNPQGTREGIKETFGIVGDKHPIDLVYYFSNLSYFLSWTVFLLLVVALVISLYKFKQTYLMLLALLFFFVVVIFNTRIHQAEPRYFFVVMPFIATLIGYSFGWLLKEKKISSRLTFVSISLIVLSILPFSYVALDSTHHLLIRQIWTFIKQRQTANQWVLSDYWPSAFVDALGYRITWLTVNGDDAASLHLKLPNYQPIYEDPLKIIGKTGFFIIIEDKYSEKLGMSQARKGARDLIEKTKDPVAVFEDTSPNFPFFPDSKNTVKIYEIKPT